MGNFFSSKKSIKSQPLLNICQPDDGPYVYEENGTFEALINVEIIHGHIIKISLGKHTSYKNAETRCYDAVKKLELGKDKKMSVEEFEIKAGRELADRTVNITGGELVGRTVYIEKVFFEDASSLNP